MTYPNLHGIINDPDFEKELYRAEAITTYGHVLFLLMGLLWSIYNFF